MVLGTIAGKTERISLGSAVTVLLPFVDLYRHALKEFLKPTMPLGVHSPGHVAATDEQAKEDLRPHYMAMMNRIGLKYSNGTLPHDALMRSIDFVELVSFATAAGSLNPSCGTETAVDLTTCERRAWICDGPTWG